MKKPRVRNVYSMLRETERSRIANGPRWLGPKQKQNRVRKNQHAAKDTYSGHTCLPRRWPSARRSAARASRAWTRRTRTRTRARRRPRRRRRRLPQRQAAICNNSVVSSPIGTIESSKDGARSVAFQNTFDRPKPDTVSTTLENQRNRKSRPVNFGRWLAPSRARLFSKPRDSHTPKFGTCQISTWKGAPDSQSTSSNTRSKSNDRIPKFDADLAQAW